MQLTEGTRSDHAPLATAVPAASPMMQGRARGVPGIMEPDQEPYDAVRGERAVWRAVILQALMDAACMSHKKENQQAKQEAMVWLRGTSPDFVQVCHFAGFEPEYVRRMIRGCLERNCTWRAAPGTGAPRPRRTRDGRTRRAPLQRR